MWICILVLGANDCVAQSDILILKKKGRKVESYFPGSRMLFTTTWGVYDAYISKVRNDSVFLVQYVINYVPVLDTVSRYYFAIDYKDITAILKQKSNFIYGSGMALMGGGTLLALGGLTTWALAKPDTRYYARPELVGAAAALAAAGYGMTKIQDKKMKIGKKYTLTYLNIH